MYVEVLPKGKGFKGLIEYNMDKENPAHGEVIGGNVHPSDTKFVVQQFNEVRDIRRDIKDPVFHVVMGWHPDDAVDNALMETSAERVLDGMGFDRENHQYLLVRHYDARHHHLHIVANRIAYNGSVFVGKMSGIKANEARKQLERELGFTPAVPIASRLDHLSQSPDDSPHVAVRTLDNTPYEGDSERAENNRRKYEDRTFQRGVKNVMHQAIKRGIMQCDGTFESLDKVLQEDGVVSPSWSFNKAGFNGASFTLISAYDPDQAEQTPDGQSWTFNGKKLGWNKDAILEQMERRREYITAQDERAKQLDLKNLKMQSERLEKQQSWLKRKQLARDAYLQQREEYIAYQEARSRASFDERQRRESDLVFKRMVATASDPFGRHLGRLFRTKNTGYSKPRSPGVTRSVLRAFDVKIGFSPIRRTRKGPAIDRRPDRGRGPNPRR